jgi:hypothetical protein
VVDWLIKAEVKVLQTDIDGEIEDDNDGKK